MRHANRIGEAVGDATGQYSLGQDVTDLLTEFEYRMNMIRHGRKQVEMLSALAIEFPKEHDAIRALVRSISNRLI